MGGSILRIYFTELPRGGCQVETLTSKTSRVDPRFANFLSLVVPTMCLSRLTLLRENLELLRSWLTRYITQSGLEKDVTYSLTFKKNSLTIALTKNYE